MIHIIIQMKIQNLKILEELELSFEKYYYACSNIVFSDQKILKQAFHLKNNSNALNSEEIKGLDQQNAGDRQSVRHGCCPMRQPRCRDTQASKSATGRVLQDTMAAERMRT